jgi:hypothetical protein
MRVPVVRLSILMQRHNLPPQGETTRSTFTSAVGDQGELTRLELLCNRGDYRRER